ncbi:MAG: hypothetical protein JRH06_10410 [Deltaproteobacteria bacterium]|nr:hypothetical protein [Deltaproteobacteria bacterium]MBW2137956.1 hypothetical protein [Deltaproteobacteria bacterium]
MKSDERILGDSDFVQSVLEQEDEQFERRYRLKTQGYDFDRVVDRAAEIFEMKRDRILTPDKEPERVKARSLVCYWAVKELGMAGTSVAQILGMGQSGVSRAVRRGEKLAHDRQWKLFD